MRRLLAAVLLLLLALPLAAQAEERITRFVSDVTVNTDASLDVREMIEVMAEGIEIRRGILRDFPTTYTDRNGQRVVVGFEVTGVTRDGAPEPYALEGLNNGTRIRIGDANVFLDRGLHRYEISYRTTRQIGFFADHDELYWNVTGNGWLMPIDTARVAISLPQGAVISGHREFTGPQGSRASDARVLAASGNRYVAETVRRLAPEDGFTVAVAFNKGVVTPPSSGQTLGWWMSDNAGFFALALGLVVSAGYFFFAWVRVGRDPAKGTIIPLFAPPDGLAPAAVRYVMQYGADDKAFAAAVLGLAVKRYLTIADEDGGFSVTKLAEPQGKAAITASERRLFDALPAGRTSLGRGHDARVRAARQALETALKTQYDNLAFLRNLGWFAAGLLLSLMCLVTGALLLPGEEGITGLFAIGGTAVWWGGIVGVGWASLKGVIRQRGLWRKISSLFGLVVLIPFAGAGLIAPAAILFSGDLSPSLLVMLGTAALLGLLNVVFYHLLRAPTEMGQRLRDRVEGFRLYLATAEEERLKVLHPPEKTPELFERYLPYALALDCENEWNAKFAAVLAAAAAAGAAVPAWYAGRSWSDFGRGGGFTNRLDRSLATSAAAAPSAPGRSSGMGGGGFSGGGGGGGGGRGW